jgi:hypothetical protein
VGCDTDEAGRLTQSIRRRRARLSQLLELVERLWTLTKNRKRIDAELMFHAEYGIEIQFLHEGVMAYGRRWTMRADAVREAAAKRAELEQQGWLIADA